MLIEAFIYVYNQFVFYQNGHRETLQTEMLQKFNKPEVIYHQGHLHQHLPVCHYGGQKSNQCQGESEMFQSITKDSEEQAAGKRVEG